MKPLKIQEEVVYRLIHDDGTPVHPATEERANELSQLLKDAKVLGDSCTVSSIVAMRIASVVLSNYELRSKWKNSWNRGRKNKSTVTPNDEPLQSPESSS